MHELTFKAALPNGDRAVTVSQVNGAGGTLYVYIDRYYCGSVNMRDGISIYWTPDSAKGKLQENIASWFGLDDRDAIIDRLADAGWIENNTDNYL